MAIEDAFQMMNDLDDAVSAAERSGKGLAALDVAGPLRRYQNARVLRVSAIHGMAGMAAFMAATYKVRVMFITGEGSYV
jgi:zeaxanthin epoxidase